MSSRSWVLPALVATNAAALGFVGVTWALAASGVSPSTAVVFGVLSAPAPATVSWRATRRVRVADLDLTVAWVSVPVLSGCACFWAGLFYGVLFGGNLGPPVGLFLGIVVAPVGGIVSAVALAIHLARVRSDEAGGAVVPSPRSSPLPEVLPDNPPASGVWPGVLMGLHAVALPLILPVGGGTDLVVRLCAAPLLGLLCGLVWRSVLAGRRTDDWVSAGRAYVCALACGVGVPAASLSIPVLVSGALPTPSTIAWSLGTGLALSLLALAR